MSHFCHSRHMIPCITVASGFRGFDGGLRPLAARFRSPVAPLRRLRGSASQVPRLRFPGSVAPLPRFRGSASQVPWFRFARSVVAFVAGGRGYSRYARNFSVCTQIVPHESLLSLPSHDSVHNGCFGKPNGTARGRHGTTWGRRGTRWGRRGTRWGRGGTRWGRGGTVESPSDCVTSQR